MSFGWSYPPGVTGNEPQITGIWPCIACGGAAGERDENGSDVSCPHCRGTGVEPEEFEVAYIESLSAERCADREVVDAVLDLVRCCVFDRAKPEDRRYLHAAAKLRSWRRELA